VPGRNICNGTIPKVLFHLISYRDKHLPGDGILIFVSNQAGKPRKIGEPVPPARRHGPAKSNQDGWNFAFPDERIVMETSTIARS